MFYIRDTSIYHRMAPKTNGGQMSRLIYLWPKHINVEAATKSRQKPKVRAVGVVAGHEGSALIK